jgi:hypothetical protein
MRRRIGRRQLDRVAASPAGCIVASSLAFPESFDHPTFL